MYNEELFLSSAQEIGSPFECHCFHSAPMEDNTVQVTGHFENAEDSGYAVWYPKAPKT